MENIYYWKRLGFCYMAIALSIIAGLGLLFRGIYIGVALIFFILLLALLAMWMTERDYRLYCRSEKILARKSMREKLRYILCRPQIEKIYLRFGTAENFKEFRIYFGTMSDSDELSCDVEAFLLKAQEAGKFDESKN